MADLQLILAFIGVTTPSFLLMYFAATVGIFGGNSILSGSIVGLKLFAVVIVADAIISMYKSFCKTKLTIFIALMSAMFLVFFSSILSTILTLIFFAILGVLFIKSDKKEINPVPYKK